MLKQYVESKRFIFVAPAIEDSHLELLGFGIAGANCIWDCSDRNLTRLAPPRYVALLLLLLLLLYYHYSITITVTITITITIIITITITITAGSQGPGGGEAGAAAADPGA